MVSFSRSAQVATDQTDGADAVASPVPGAAAGAFPRVNLMPEAVAAEARVHRSKVVLVGATAASLAIVAGLYVMASSSVSAAQDSLDGAQAQAASLATEEARYADVPKVQAEVASATTQQYQALGAEVRWSFLLNDLALTIPAGTSLTSFAGTVTPVPPAAGGSAAGAPATPGGQSGVVTSVLGHPGIGTITYQGEALGYPQVASFLDSQAKQKTLLDPFVNTVNAGSGPTKKGLTFTSTATVTAAALSHRYDTKAGS